MQKRQKPAATGARRRKLSVIHVEVSPEPQTRVLGPSTRYAPNVLRTALLREGMSEYAADVIVALREHCEDQDNRLARLERAK